MSAFQHALVAALGMALLHFLWQGALIGLGAFLSLRLLRTASPQARYAVACGALLLCTALPVAGVLRGLPSASPVMAASEPSAPSALELPLAVQPAPATGLASALRPRLNLVVLLWALGTALAALRLGLGMAWLKRLGSRAENLADPHWTGRLQDLATRMGVTRKVRLRVSAALQTPIVSGWWRPVILVPAGLLTGMAPALLEALLAHELAHLKRHDYLVNLLQSVVEVLLFYHPAVWWLSRRLREEREQIADDLAARVLGEPRRLALALQELDLFQFSTPNPALAATGGLLMNRIRRLFQPQPRPLSWKPILSMVAISGACLGGVALFGFEALAPAMTKRLTTPPPPPPLPPAPPVPPAPPAPPEPPAKPGTEASAYALVQKGHPSMLCAPTPSDLATIEALQRKQSADFLWYRQAGKEYLVQDSAMLAQLEGRHGPMEALSRQQQALSVQMRGHSEHMKALSAQMKALGEHQKGPSERMKALGEQMKQQGAALNQSGVQLRDLQARLRSLPAGDPARSTLKAQVEAQGRQMDALGVKMDELGQRMDAEGKVMDANAQPMEDLGRKMEEASKPMEALGRQMEALGRQQEQAAHSLEAELRKLAETAIAQGKAQRLN